MMDSRKRSKFDPQSVAFDSVILNNLFLSKNCDPNTLKHLSLVNKKFNKIARTIIINKLTSDDWYCISRDQTLSEDFIREFKHIVYWSCISTNQTLTEDFIREFKNEVNWICISIHQLLTEDFIREFKHKVHWYWIAFHQTLSENFIREFGSQFLE